MLRILIVGPDGTGKTSAAEALGRELGARGFQVRARHGAPSARRSTAGVPVEQPHLQPRRSLPSSTLKVLLSFVRYAATNSRRRSDASRVEILERGWNDQTVDPLRYRLHESSAGLVRWLGRLLPRSDLCVLLAGDAALVHARKAEISVAEIDRQIEAWRQVSRRGSRETIELDSIRESPEEIATAIADLTVRRVGEHDRWRTLWPSPARVDLKVVAGRRAIAASSFYQPMTRRARDANRVARIAFRAGLRVRASAPLPAMRSILAACGLGGLAVATMRSSQDGRFIVGVADDHELVAVLKVGRADDAALANEARFLTLLEPTGMVPRLLASGQFDDLFYVAAHAVTRTAGSDPISVEQAADLATKLQSTSGLEPIVHGDLAPWNVVPTGHGLVLLDWEHAALARRPLYDLSHFVVQCGALLGQWSPHTAASLLTAENSLGAKHLAALGVDVARAPALVRDYLGSVGAPTDDRVRTYRAELAAGLG